jgi:hypothetical protein
MLSRTRLALVLLFNVLSFCVGFTALIGAIAAFPSWIITLAMLACVFWAIAQKLKQSPRDPLFASINKKKQEIQDRRTSSS